MKPSTVIFRTILVLFIFCLGVFCEGDGDTGMAPMEKTEQEALYHAIQGFVGTWWNGSDLYPDPCGWTPIQGVSCDLYDGLWYVTALNIGPVHDNSLDCAHNVEFKLHLFKLKHLKSLSFFNCFISPLKHPVTIPENVWYRLAGSLESLEFRSNPGLVGQIPTGFGDLRKLQTLVLLENGLSGHLPTSIGNLVSLRRLVVSGNWFTGTIPDNFAGLGELLILDLSRNSLSGRLPGSFGGLSSLLKLDLSNNHLEGKLPNELGRMKNLTLLDLRNNKFSGGLIQSLQEMASLEEMALSNNPIGGDLLSLEWQKLQKLVVLDLSNTGLTGEVSESLAEVKGLRFLGLNDNHLTGNPSPKLATLPSVTALYLNGNNLTGELKFSVWFYGKMGRRFGAWNNPNLCYPVELMSTSHVPFGVKPCDQEVTDLEPHTWTKLGDGNGIGNVNQDFHFMASLGFSSYSIDGLWWGFILAEISAFTLLLSFSS